MFKSTFGISKKKLIENYEGQIKERDARNKSLRKEKDYYKKSLEQALIEREQLNKDNIYLNEKDEYLRNEIDGLKVDNDKLTKKLIENGEIISELSERNIYLVKENKALKESKAILDEMTEELIKEVDKLVNKKINRLEALKKRTKRLRIKKKCEARILELEKRYLE